METIQARSLRTLQVKLIKIGAKVVRHSRYVIFQMAEVMVSRSLLYIFERISRLKLANRVRLMPRIVEKLEFMKGRSVKVYIKAGIGRKVGHKKPCFRANFQQNCLEKENSSQLKVIFGKIIDIGMRKLCFYRQRQAKLFNYVKTQRIFQVQL